MRISLRWLLPAGAIVAALALVFAWMTASGTAARLSANSSSTAQPGFQAACPAASGDNVTCFAIYRTPRRHAASANALPAGYKPGDLRAAYRLAGLSVGAGRTVAVVDAFNDPNAASDMAHYRAQFGLPACTAASHCFRKVNENGGSKLPPANAGWAAEISLDLDMVSAICSKCHILLVEASTTKVGDLGTAVNTAVRLGATYVSNSYGGSEFAGEAAKYNHFFNHPGVALTFSAGDSGFGVNYPAASQYVTAVGGTSLVRARNSRGWAESAWSGTGSGCSRFSAKPPWQPTLSGCRTHRTVADVSAVADPATGVLVYDSYQFPGWAEFGGTSASAPIIAAVYARAGVPRAHTYPASYPYHHASKTTINDVVGGSNGVCSPAYLCNGVKGYDGPTGLGTPNGAGAFTF